MPRCRLIKPDFFTDSSVATLSPFARLFFIGLWLYADREGFVEDDVRRLKALLFPYDQEVDCEALAVELHGKDMIRRYPAVEKHGWIWVKNFLRHQSPHPKEAASLAPKYDLDSGRFFCEAGEKNVFPCNFTERSSDPSTDPSTDPDPDPSLSDPLILSTTARARDKYDAFALDEAFLALLAAYPASRRQDSMLIRQNFIRAFQGVAPSQQQEFFDAIVTALEQHKASEQWQTVKLIPMFGKWIDEKRWIQTLAKPTGFSTQGKTAGNLEAARRFANRKVDP